MLTYLNGTLMYYTRYVYVRLRSNQMVTIRGPSDSMRTGNLPPRTKCEMAIFQFAHAGEMAICQVALTASTYPHTYVHTYVHSLC